MVKQVEKVGNVPGILDVMGTNMEKKKVQV